MPEKNTNNVFSQIVSTGKDFVAMLRDGVLLLLAILLIGWPQAINNILLEAGFEEGSFAGIKWKAKLTQSDQTLLKAQALIADLKEQNEKLNKALMGVNSTVANSEFETDRAELEQLNIRLSEDSALVQAAVKKTTTSNAPLIQKAQISTGTAVTWGVVYGGDRDLDAAKYEVGTIASKYGLTNTAIYKRNNSFRSVATSADRIQAEQLLTKAKERRKDAYVVNMADWCPDTIERQGYFQCLTP